MLSALLDVAIGMILLYLILSIMTSATNELISGWLHLRARNLRAFVEGLFKDATAQAASPEGLNADTFFLNTVIATQLSPRVMQHGLPANGQLRAADVPAYIRATDFSAAILQMLRAQPAPASGADSTPLESMRLTVERMNSNLPLKKALQAALVRAEGDLDKFRLALENWYDDSMERLRGWYKRNVLFIMVVISGAIAFGLNIDSITVANALLQNPALRESIAQQAALTGEQLTARATAIAAIRSDASGTGNPALGAQTTPGANNPPPAEPNRLPNTPTAAGPTGLAGYYELSALNIPLGWGIESGAPWDLGYILRKLLGIAITVFAVSQGAPFWFDLLNKTVNLRAAGRPPAESPRLQDEEAASRRS